VPPVGAGLEIVTVPIAPAAPSTLAGDTDRLTSPGGVIVSGAEPVRPEVDAEIFAVVVAVTGVVVMLNVADVWPAVIVTGVAGVAAALSLAMVTVSAVGAGFESVMVPTEGESPGTVLGFSVIVRLEPVIVRVSEALLLP